MSAESEFPLTPEPEPEPEAKVPRTYGEPEPLVPDDPSHSEQMPARADQRVTENLPDTQVHEK
jgi:hypothetical protein